MSTGAGFSEKAPVVLRVARDVPLPPERVWSILRDPDRWPHWFRRVRFASLRGPLAPGSAIIWQIDGLRISSLVIEVEENRLMGLTLRMMGGRGGMRWTLQSLPSGGTRIVLEESWSGVLVWLLRWTLRRTLEGSRREWLEALAAVTAR